MQSDETKTRQILFNLLSNAAKFTHEGKISLVAKKSELDGVPAVILSVTDSGIGMTPEQLDTLFEAFVQADETISSDYGGTGLGMALTKQICELMGGTITAESKKNFGTTFIVTLPLNKTVKVTPE